MIETRRTDEFSDWLSRLKDPQAKVCVIVRIQRVEEGNFGDAVPVGDGISELRIHYGPGYRLYIVSQGETVVVLLCGGDKSTQKKDIEKARKLAKELE